MCSKYIKNSQNSTIKITQFFKWVKDVNRYFIKEYIWMANKHINNCSTPFFKNKFIYLFIYLWLHWVFITLCGLSLVAASRGYSSLQFPGFSLWWLLLLRSTGSRHAGFSSCGTRASVVVVHRLSCSAACRIFPAQGSNPCPLHWQADS